MIYNIYDKDLHWLGTVRATDEEHAVKRAKEEGMPTAHSAIPK